MSEAVHAPVPGRGSATNKNNPQVAYFVTLWAFLSAFFSSQIAILSRCLTLFIQLRIRRMKSKINGTGSILPIKHTMNAFQRGTPRRTAAIRPPLSSSMGKREIMKIVNSPGILLPNKSTKKFPKQSFMKQQHHTLVK